jgi:hypothetical protein
LTVTRGPELLLEERESGGTFFGDGEKLLDYTLAAPVAGKVGVWSKTDSISEFADYTVTP